MEVKLVSINVRIDKSIQVKCTIIITDLLDRNGNFLVKFYL